MLLLYSCKEGRGVLAFRDALIWPGHKNVLLLHSERNYCYNTKKKTKCTVSHIKTIKTVFYFYLNISNPLTNIVCTRICTSEALLKQSDRFWGYYTSLGKENLSLSTTWLCWWEPFNMNEEYSTQTSEHRFSTFLPPSYFPNKGEESSEEVNNC